MLEKISKLKKYPRRIYQKWEVSRLAGPKLLRAMAKNKPSAFFVQIGANDGKMMDPLRKTIIRSQWHGLVIEPVPELFDRLSNNYDAFKDRVTPVNAAIAQHNGIAPFYLLRNLPDEKELPAWAHGLGSFNKDVLLGHINRLPNIQAHLLEIEVPCLSWQSLCDEHDVTHVDLVLTDTEGYDFEIISQIDFTKTRPTTLIYEHHHFDQNTDQKCIEMLKSLGYVLFREGLDTWALDALPGKNTNKELLNSWPTWIAKSPYAAAL